ncbi:MULTISPECIES: hypothetical protein [Microbacterium]|uniref:hypothetical protein n=1 Tax=Microbacterium TaxID=33882 RepID=UPI0008DB14D1|nr:MULTISPECIES: hypothetical protein [Microbacterium]MAY50129.1 hypothetical protein [Microbacterium sp.]HAM11860.1 hypothetical protein [Microbacterium sp.]HAS32514.1 hypothetical protein [Microbacterium sp.]HBR88783.1 hypothetical protein [Microbacterium sp.]|tara:strand:+ start:979 stop:1440 length:462 start_codon:yes stop_codon:yes gene_type:complete
MTAAGFSDDIALETDRQGEWGRFPDDAPERAALMELSRELAIPLRPLRMRVRTQEGSRVEVDGAASDGSVFVQVSLRRGDFTSQHRNKIMADMFKLSWLRTAAAPGARAILCVGVNAAAAFRPGGWLPRAAPDMHIEVWVWDGERIVGLASRP